VKCLNLLEALYCLGFSLHCLGL